MYSSKSRRFESEKEYNRHRERVHCLRKVYVVSAAISIIIDFCVLLFIVLSLSYGDGFSCCSACAPSSFKGMSASSLSRDLNGTCVLLDASLASQRLNGCGIGSVPGCVRVLFPSLCAPSLLNAAYSRSVQNIVNVVIVKLVTLGISFISLLAVSYKPLKHTKRKFVVRIIVYVCTIIGIVLSIVIFLLRVGEDFQSPTCKDSYASRADADDCRAARSLCGLTVVLVITKRGSLTIPAAVSLANALLGAALLLLRHLFCRKRMAPTYLTTVDDIVPVDIVPMPPASASRAPVHLVPAARPASHAQPAAHAHAHAHAPLAPAFDGNTIMQGPSMTEDEFLLQLTLANQRAAPVYVSPYGFESQPLPSPGTMPFSTLRRGTGAAPAGAAHAPHGKWACLRCTAHNSSKRAVCKMCGNPCGVLLS